MNRKGARFARAAYFEVFVGYPGLPGTLCSDAGQSCCIIGQVPDRECTMLRSIPWDVYAAGAIAGAVALGAIFDPAPAIFIVIYLGLCAYIAVQTFSSELE